MSAWTDPRLAYAYVNLDAISETLEAGSTEHGCIREAMNKIELADQYVESRQRTASADTRPEGGDAQQAPFTSGAVAKPDAQKEVS